MLARAYAANGEAALAEQSLRTAMDIAPSNIPVHIELAQLLLRHPGIAKPTFFLRESAKSVHCLTEIFPQLRGWGEAPCLGDGW